MKSVFYLLTAVCYAAIVIGCSSTPEPNAPPETEVQIKAPFVNIKVPTRGGEFNATELPPQTVVKQNVETKKLVAETPCQVRKRLNRCERAVAVPTQVLEQTRACPIKPRERSVLKKSCDSKGNCVTKSTCQRQVQKTCRQKCNSRTRYHKGFFGKTCYGSGSRF